MLTDLRSGAPKRFGGRDTLYMYHVNTHTHTLRAYSTYVGRGAKCYAFRVIYSTTNVHRLLPGERRDSSVYKITYNVNPGRECYRGRRAFARTYARRTHANRDATSGHPARRQLDHRDRGPGFHAGEVPARPLSPGTDARLAVRDQKEQVPGRRRPARCVRRAGRPAAASRMAGPWCALTARQRRRS